MIRDNKCWIFRGLIKWIFYNDSLKALEGRINNDSGLKIDELSLYPMELSKDALEQIHNTHDKNNVHNLNKKRQEIIRSEEKIFFMHMPKTAGTSIHTYMKSFYPMINADPFNINTSYDNKLARITLVQSHMNKSQMPKYFSSEPSSKFIFFRDPEQRIISDYYFLKEFPQEYFLEIKNMDLLAFVMGDDDNMRKKEGHLKDNIYVRYLIDGPPSHRPLTEKDVAAARQYLETFDFIGFVENYNYYFDLLCDFYYIPRPDTTPKYNTIENLKKHHKKTTQKELHTEVITDAIKERLEELTKYDYMVYEAAKKISAKKILAWSQNRKS